MAQAIAPKKLDPQDILKLLRALRRAVTTPAPKNCRSQLAGDGVRKDAIRLKGPIASKLAPTGIPRWQAVFSAAGKSAQ
ncbi:hypothetical protein HX866_32430 [Pseudomonas gingeri]|uniref:hypothetical protein n=1 Tax=Pseudomonas gingeri TaxID=117681 RepID=UPI0015A222FB|nr:hypothetical protein [Pseudomonas gingeri]NWA29596.1 hypothetical protein [Pseudomonas gingeri]NWD73365.1 hypothetical protein [Pseudomonas gingeri]